MRILLLPLMLSAATLPAQNFTEKELKTTINEVTVFLDAAQLFESGETLLPAGNSVIKIKNLSPFLDEKSIQVKTSGDFAILSVNHRLNYINTLKKDQRTDSLRRIIESIESKLSIERARLEVLKEKQSLLNENKILNRQNAGTSMALLKQAMDFYEAEITRIKEEEIKLHKSMDTKRAEQKKIEQQLREMNEQKILPTSEIDIRVTSEKPTSAKVLLTYLTGNAGWFPKYDVRVHNINKPLELTYKAEVFQNTGVDWKNVKLKFSNANPNQSGLAPELTTWRLNYARNTLVQRNLYGMASAANMGTVRGRVVTETGEPMPGVNVVVKGTTIGTVTDVNGNYSLTLPHPNATLAVSFVGYNTQEVLVTKPDMTVRLQEDIRALSEVVVVGYGLQGKTSGVKIRGTSSFDNTIATTVVENQTTVEIAVDIPYSIKSDGEKLMVDLKKYAIVANYEYYAVPKLDKDAFLVARITNWDQYNLLEGEANLYFEDGFVGRSILNAKALTDTLTISLGRDKSIVIGRTKVEQFTKKKTIGSNQIESRGFKITVRNKKSQPLKLTVFDQIPVAVINEITVTATELSQGKLDEQTGKVSWELQVEPQQQKELTLQYDVKYNKKEKVLLE